MNRLCVLLFLGIIPCKYAWPQQRGTTVIVLGYSQDKIILAADSRATKADGGFDDHFCKIIELGDDVIFAATGIVSDSSGYLPEDLKFDAYSAAREAYDQIKQRSPQARAALSIGKSLSEQVAQQWSGDFASRMVAVAKLKPELINQPNGGQITGIFVATGDNRMEAVAETLTCTPENIETNCEGVGGTFAMLDEIHFYPYGTSDIVSQALVPTGNEWRHFQEKRSKNPDQADREFAIRLAELTEDFSTFKKYVGGKIDAVELRPGKKPYWIQQKCECKQKSAANSMPELGPLTTDNCI
jgi:hypothetical protein